MIPSTSSQPSCTRRLTAATLASRSQSITSASNNAVKREPGSAQGTATCTTPCVAHVTRGTGAIPIVRYGQVSRCRQRRSRVS